MTCLGKIDPIEIEKKTKIGFRIKIEKEDLETSMQEESWPKGWKIRRFYRNFKTSKNSQEKVKEDVKEVKEDVEKVTEVVHDKKKHQFKYPGAGMFVEACCRTGCNFRTLII